MSAPSYSKLITRSQRWRSRRAKFVEDNSTIDPREYAVDVISCTQAAKPFVLSHHCRGSFPATRGVDQKRRG